jgi:signal transduction histidine kinase
MANGSPHILIHAAKAPQLASADAAVEAALMAWRRRLIDILLAVIALVQAPLLILCLLGRAMPFTPAASFGLTVAWVLVVVAALLRRASVRTRTWLYCCAAYLTIIIVSLAQPRGPFAQIGVVTIPVVLLVLAGARFGRAAALANVVILFASPSVRHLPAVASLLVHPSVRAAPDLKWIQIAGCATILITQVVLLDRYQQFLLRTLAGRSIAIRQLEHEIRQRRDLEHEVAAIADNERRRLGRDLHDGVCQQITGAFLRCQALERRQARGESADSGDFGALSSLLADALEEARNVALGLCPLDSDPSALAHALRELAARVQSSSSVLCEFHASGNVETPDLDAAQHLYRIAQEAVNNAVRHARAGRIRVELCDSGDFLLLLIEDDGVGLPDPVPSRGMGLRTMASRARLLDGELTIGPAAGAGLRITCRAPRDRAAWAGPKHRKNRNDS